MEAGVLYVGNYLIPSQVQQWKVFRKNKDTEKISRLVIIKNLIGKDLFETNSIN